MIEIDIRKNSKVKSNKSVLLVLDVGTTSARAALFTLDGRMMDIEGQEYHSIYGDHGVIDHDPDTWIHALRHSISKVVERCIHTSTQIETVVVTTQRSTMIPVDGGGVPLCNAISWQDKRTSRECAALSESIQDEEVYRKTGLRIDPYFSLPKIMWLNHHLSTEKSRLRYFLTVHDFILYQLTECFVTDVTQASRTMLFNIVESQWDSDLARIADTSLDLLPQVVPTGTIVGKVTVAGAQNFGLPQGIPVIAGGGDQQCSAVGLGAVQSGLAEVTGGTGSFLVVPSDTPAFDPERRVLVSKSAVSGQYIMEAGLFTTGAVLRWLRDLVTTDSTELIAYETLLEEAQDVPVGSNGIVVIPHFAGSAAPYWDAEARGSILNLKLSHTRGALVRAVLEGIALEVTKNLSIIRQLVDAKGTPPIDMLHVSGGLSRSPLFNQIQADAYGANVRAFSNEQATARGAAVLGLVALRVQPSIAKGCQQVLAEESYIDFYPSEVASQFYANLLKCHDDYYQALSTL